MTAQPLDPFTEDIEGFSQDPFPFFRAIREHSPIWWSSKSNQWIVTGYEETLDLLRDNRVASNLFQPEFENAMPESLALRSAQRNWISMINGGRHEQLRKPFFDACAPAAIQALSNSIQEQVDILLNEPRQTGHLEVIYGFACPLSTKVIATWFGIEAAMEREFRAAVHRTCSHFSPTVPGFVPPVFKAAETLLDIIDVTIDERRKKPGNDVISLMAAHIGESLTREEIRDNCLLILFASYETSVHLIGNALELLAANQAQLAKLRSGNVPMNAAIEELIRLGGPVQILSRYASDDFTYRDYKFTTGQHFRLIISAANRDTRFGGDAESLNLERPFAKHISFGFGPHFCIGASLVRMQLGIVITSFLKSFSEITLAKAPVWHPSKGIRGMQELELLLVS